MTIFILYLIIRTGIYHYWHAEVKQANNVFSKHFPIHTYIMLLCCKLKQKMCRGDILLFKLIKIKIAITSLRKTSEAQSAAIVKIDRSCNGMYRCLFVLNTVNTKNLSFQNLNRPRAENFDLTRAGRGISPAGGADVHY